MDDLTHLKTPAFLVDKAIVQRNCDRMRDKATRSGVIFRPHVKTHKTVEIARMQHGGAAGPITVSTLAEAEFFAGAGFRDITYAFPIAPDKLERASALARRVDRLALLVDNPIAVNALERMGSGLLCSVFLKVDCGYHRAGVDPESDDALRLVERLTALEHVRFEGLLTHAGHSYNAANADEIRRVAAAETAALTRLRERSGRPLMRSIGSTPTASVVERFVDAEEVRPGNYVFYDAFQATIGSCRMEDCAVSVLSTVVGSYPERRSMVIDAGALALSKDAGPNHVDAAFGYGLVCDEYLRPVDARITALSQEHGKVAMDDPLPVGSRVRIIPNHSCLTAAMFDAYDVVENGRITDRWRPVRGW